MLTPPPLSLYIHIPWCVRKCPYCDFNSHRRLGNLPEQIYIDALLADLDQDLPLAGGRQIDSLFFGGGTPSLFSPDAIGRLLEAVNARLVWHKNIEITLEANPGTIERGRFAAYRQIGVNRLSIGVQSFDDRFLSRLGRIHGGRDALLAIEDAQAAGFDNFNIDLMYGLPDQDLNAALNDIKLACQFNGGHISHYQLTMEPGTVFAQNPPQRPDDDQLWRMQRHGQRRLAMAGFSQYEISAYAAAGHECRHNLNYWQFGDYLGIGAGAHGKITDPSTGNILRYHKQSHPQRYMDTAFDDSRLVKREAVKLDELPMEFMMNVLRLNNGAPKAFFQARTGLADHLIAPVLSSAIADGLLDNDPTVIRPTVRGRRYLNELIMRFMASLPPQRGA